ncbi:barstar family protein [Kitasatospora sp. NPDC004669]|uniref:barstar family protein n=1 Tax=Kitasatospora sp. NPDC004669 TaxID=3154555 RepID=UPI00339FA405
MTLVRSLTRNELFHEWARALSFPAYFGHTWDAFEECLTDTRYPPRQPDPSGLLILVSGAEAVLVDEPVRELTTLLQILDTPPPVRARACGCCSSATAPTPWNDGCARRPGPCERSAPARTAAVRRGVPPTGGTPARGWVSPLPPPSAGRRPRRSRRASPAGRARRPR